MQSYIAPKYKSKKTVYTGLVIAGLIASMVVVAALWSGGLSGRKKSAMAEMADKLSEEKLVLRNDMLLHTGFSKLQQLDEQFGLLVTGNASSADIQLADSMVTQAESTLVKTLDSIDKSSEKFNAWSNVVMVDSITASFRLAIANRKYFASIRKSMDGKAVNLGDDEKLMFQLQHELQQKDEAIAVLQDQLKTQKKQPAVLQAPAGGKQEWQKMQEEMETALAEEEMRNTGLLGITKSLKEENERLNQEIRQVRKSAVGGEEAVVAAKSRNQVLKDEINELTAELNFARIDCNLTRADAEKIISNSRQRKALLADALQSLKNLSASENPSVLKKVKEKTNELNQIAATVRD